MNTITLGPHASDFIWASGIENTFVPQIRGGYRALDEYELMGHYEHWREDLALGAELGLQAIRWGVPWYRVEPTQGQFDWSWTDQVIPYLVNDLGITPIIDLMHYGCPFWLKREFASDEYPWAVAAYAAAFARRYGDLIRWYTPLNEPLVNALMCGKRGIWPPYLRSESGYLRVMVQIAKGIINTVAAIKAIVPDALMVHVEATGLSHAARQDLQGLAVEDQRRGFLCYDLITGLVTAEHPLFPWLVRNGISPNELAALVERRIELDVLGLNFYPQWSVQRLDVDSRGRLTYRAAERDGSSFASIISDYHARYNAPVLITETSAVGSEGIRSQWLESSVAAIKTLRGAGVPVLGYTWFPLFTMIDWRYRYGTAPLEKYYLDLGLYKRNQTTAAGRWQATPLVAQFQGYVANAAASVGAVVVAGDLVED